jgi:hypothetical protein
MKMFRMFQTSAREAPRTEGQAFPESRPSEQAPNDRRVQSAASSEPTKADEIIRLMAQRRDRHKGASWTPR